MPALKSEFLYHHYRSFRRNRKHRRSGKLPPDFGIATLFGGHGR